MGRLLTRYDIRIALFILAGVVALGLAIGYGVGYMTRPEAQVGAPANIPPAFDAAAGSGAKLADGATVPGYNEVYVNDYADLLDTSAEGRIRAALIELYDQTGVEMTVLTIKQMSDYGHDGVIESFATRLFNTWGIGNATRNDGVLVLVSRFDRRMRIELGDGYGYARDGDMKRVIDDVFLPAFKKDKYQAGILAGVDATIFEISGFYPGGYDSGNLQRGWQVIWHKIRATGGAVLGFLLVPFGGLALWVRRYLRRRPRPCQNCGTTMLLAGEEADDEHLDGGQRLEEFLKSVDYDVWHCPECAEMTINRYPSLFSRHGSCPRCQYKTMRTTSTVLQRATTGSAGHKRIDYNCKNCDYANSEFRSIPRITKSSSSGSGGSSFGGGSSSGGGASGGW